MQLKICFDKPGRTNKTFPTDQPITNHGELKNVTIAVGEGVVYMFTQGIQLKMVRQHKTNSVV
jgi:hypothetical protein